MKTIIYDEITLKRLEDEIFSCIPMREDIIRMHGHHYDVVRRVFRSGTNIVEVYVKIVDLD